MSKRNKSTGELVVVLIIAALFGILGLAMVKLFPQKLYIPKGKVEKAEALESPVPSESFTFPWEGFLFVLAIIGIVVVLGLITYFIVKSAKKKKIELLNRRKKAEVNTKKWNSILKSHNKVLSKWGEYELDLEKVIKFPLFSDPSHPSIADFHRSMTRAEISRPEVLDKNENAHGSSYAIDVTDLKHSFRIAEDVATKTSWKNMPREEQRQLETALKMLNIAQDSEASPFERQTAYKRALAEVEGLINLPERGVLKLEQEVRKELMPA